MYPEPLLELIQGRCVTKKKTWSLIRHNDFAYIEFLEKKIEMKKQQEIVRLK
jgi:hypothetical protein